MFFVLVSSRALDTFRSSSTPVLLCSLKAGNLGLNLACASYVFLVSPWYNVYVGMCTFVYKTKHSALNFYYVHTEEQAIARVDRMGQRRRVRVERLVMEDTVEEQMLKIQAS